MRAQALLIPGLRAPFDAPEEEIISEYPSEEIDPSAPVVDVMETDATTVYVADALGVAFEAPVDWVITVDGDASENSYILREAELSAGVYTHLIITAVPGDQLEPFVMAQYGVQPGECSAVELLEQPGLCLETTALVDGGVMIIRHVHVAVVDGTVYAVEIAGAPEAFDAVVADVLQPVCASMRLIP